MIITLKKIEDRVMITTPNKIVVLQLGGYPNFAQMKMANKTRREQ